MTLLAYIYADLEWIVFALAERATRMHITVTNPVSYRCILAGIKSVYYTASRAF